MHLLSKPSLELTFTLLSHVQVIAHRDPQVLFCRTAAQVPSRSPLMQGVILEEVWDFPSACAELHEVPSAPFLHLIQVLNCSPALQSIDLLLFWHCLSACQGGVILQRAGCVWHWCKPIIASVLTPKLTYGLPDALWICDHSLQNLSIQTVFHLPSNPSMQPMSP